MVYLSVGLCFVCMFAVDGLGVVLFGFVCLFGFYIVVGNESCLRVDVIGFVGLLMLSL